MTIQLEVEHPVDPPVHVLRRLVLVWREPSTRRFVRVARLEILSTGEYRFEYEPGARVLPGFVALDQYPDLSQVQSLPALPAFFRNRIMSSERPTFQRYATWLGLDVTDAAGVDLPLEMLLRSGGGRATDTFHVIEEPHLADGDFVTRFFVSGISHISHADDVLAVLARGALLILRDEPTNEVNAMAVALDTTAGQQVGWVPDYLCDEIHRLRADGFALAASIEQVNPDAPPHVRVLCRITGRK